MVTIVIHNPEGAPLGGLEIANLGKATSNAPKLRQAFGNRCITYAKLCCHRDRGQGVQDVMDARKIQTNREWTELALARLTSHIKLHACTERLHSGRYDLSVRRQAIGCNGARNERNNFTHISVVGADDRTAIKRQALRKFDESTFQFR